MNMLSSAVSAVNPFTRLYMLTYLPALGALLRVHEYVVGLDDAHLSNRFENNFLILLLMMLSIHVAQLPFVEGRSKNWNGFWDMIRVFYVLAAGAAALRLAYVSLAALLGIIGSDAHLHYMIITFAP